ncbi:MAG: HIG1 domain-containing protein [Hyphomicrobiales bacterium]|nr:HIG1 domain-containing protein [Hyphomicrobiales bacterium]MCP5371786.1 HIG1 domain-containing protein [Hyphomicrobiales bacterium]
MHDILPLLLMLCMAATAVVLIVGILAFAVQGQFNARYANKLMRARVILQGLAVLVFALITILAVS